MDTLFVEQNRISDGGHTVEVNFRQQNTLYEVYFKTDDIQLNDNLEAYISAALVPCMRNGTRLHADGPISSRYLKNLEAVQDYFQSWKRHFSRVKVENVTAVDLQPSTEMRVGAFFTAGVDSFFTLIKHHDEITDLIYVHGYDIPLSDHVLRQHTSTAIRKAAREFNKRVIEIETNVKPILTDRVSWSLTHGAALAAIAHLLYPQFKRVYIPATYAFDELFPWGSHPSLDPLWSSDVLEIIHDGCEASRIEKVQKLADCEVALQTLRVCVENRNGAYNCGVCDKCLRTMINLRMAGVLEHCTTFEKPFDLKRVERLRVPKLHKRTFLVQILKQLEATGSDPDLAAALRKALKKPGLKTKVIRTIHKINTSIFGNRWT